MHYILSYRRYCVFGPEKFLPIEHFFAPAQLSRALYTGFFRPPRHPRATPPITARPIRANDRAPFFAQIFRTIFRTKYFFPHYFFAPPIFFPTLFFRTTNIFSHNIFSHHQNYFRTKYFRTTYFFAPPKLFSHIIFSHHQYFAPIFSHQYFFLHIF